MISQLVRSPFTRLRSSMKSEGLQRMIGSWDWVTSAHLPVGLNIAFARAGCMEDQPQAAGYS